MFPFNNATNSTKAPKMSKLIQTITIVSFLFLASISNAEDLPKFFEDIQHEKFFPDGISEWKLQKNIEGENYYLLQWGNPSQHEITCRSKQISQTYNNSRQTRGRIHSGSGREPGHPDEHQGPGK